MTTETVRVQYTDAGRKYIENLAELAKLQVCVGFQAGPAEKDSDIQVVEVAYYNNFGTVNEDGSVRIPARPFMNAAIDNHVDEISAFIFKRLRAVVRGSIDAQMALNQIGSKCKGITQSEIRDGDWVPNSPATIRRKGSSKPLIDTGTMRQSVMYIVKERE